MDAREANRRTLAVYEAHADAYLTDLPPFPAPAVAALLDRVVSVAPGGHVLEIGTGPGEAASHLEGHGLTVHRTDATVAFVERLRQHGHEADVLDVLTDDLGGPYDVLLALAVLLHLAADDLRVVLQRATESCSWLAFSVKEGDGDRWTLQKLGVPRWFRYWREPQLRELLTAAGWDVTWLLRDSGRHDEWLTVLARRSGSVTG